MSKKLIAASILDFNPLTLEHNLKNLFEAGIDWLHYDVMDGHFVNNLSFGPKILAAITEKFNITVDCHLMVKINDDINEYLKPYVAAKTNRITVHYEALTESQIKSFFAFCQQYNIKKGLAINPDTEIAAINSYLPELDMILIMSVQPGKGGQKFIATTISKISALKAMLTENNLKTLIQIDGGINEDLARLCFQNGADIVVMGSYLINNLQLPKIIRNLKNE